MGINARRQPRSVHLSGVFYCFSIGTNREQGGVGRLDATIHELRMTRRRRSAGCFAPWPSRTLLGTPIDSVALVAADGNVPMVDQSGRRLTGALNCDLMDLDFCLIGACLVRSTSCPLRPNHAFSLNIFGGCCKNSENTAIALFFKAEGTQVLRAMTRIFPADSRPVHRPLHSLGGVGKPANSGALNARRTCCLWMFCLEPIVNKFLCCAFPCPNPQKLKTPPLALPLQKAVRPKRLKPIRWTG